MINFPAPQPDQSLDSLAALTWAHNPWPNWESACRELFGGDVFKRRCVGFGAFNASQARLGRTWYDDPAVLLANHCYLEVIRPFTPARTYRTAVARLLSGNIRVRGIVLKSPLSEAPLYCPDCVEREIGSIGYAYKHRTHQALGVSVCSLHGASLATIKSERVDPFVERGLLMPSGRHGHPWSFLRTSGKPLVTSGIRSYAAFVEAALNGRLPPTSRKQRFAAIMQKLGLDCRLPKHWPCCAQRVGTATLHNFDSDFLERIGAPFMSELDKHFHRLRVGHPSLWECTPANLVALAAVFAGPAEFCEHLALDPYNGSGHGARHSTLLASSFVDIPVGLIKDLLRLQPLQVFADKYEVSLAVATESLDQYPRLARQRKVAFSARTRCQPVAPYPSEGLEATGMDVSARKPMGELASWADAQLPTLTEWLTARQWPRNSPPSNPSRSNLPTDASLKSEPEPPHGRLISTCDEAPRRRRSAAATPSIGNPPAPRAS